MTDARTSLQAMLTALNASEWQLRRDECGDYRIKGLRGHIYADGAGYLLFVAERRSVRAWNAAKKRLGFCRVTQDGEDEGCLALDRLPTADEAIEIREILGIRKRREDSEATLDALRARNPLYGGSSASPMRQNDSPARVGALPSQNAPDGVPRWWLFPAGNGGSVAACMTDYGQKQAGPSCAEIGRPTYAENRPAYVGEK